MATEVSKQEAAEPQFPDFYTNSNAVLEDEASWRYGRKPDYSRTRKAWQEGKVMNHAAGSLEELVENLVKNWEIEASYKTDPTQWRTISQDKHEFRVNGGERTINAKQFSGLGTYNSLIEPNRFYSPEHNDFASSHKTFKRMMPTFAWEVLDVYSPPPKVALRWRHWGVMDGDYTAKNETGEKVTYKANGKTIDIKGVTIAEVDDQFRITALDTYFDSTDMFRQMAGESILGQVGKSESEEVVGEEQQGKCPFGAQ